MISFPRPFPIMLSLPVALLATTIFATQISPAKASETEPSLDIIMARVWANMEMAPFDLNGVIRTKDSRENITLKTGPREMTYLLNGLAPDMRIKFASDGASIQTRKNSQSSWSNLPRNRWDRPLLDSDITPRDLALDFLAWPEARYVGSGRAKTLPAFIIEADSPDKNSPIRKVRFWISKEHFVLVEAESIDKDGNVIKRFDVNGVQRFGDFWTIKEVRIATMIPGRNLSRTRTFIEIKDGTPIVKE